MTTPKRPKRFNLMLSQAERDALAALALRFGTNAAEWIRRKIRQEANLNDS